RSTGHSSRP
ncbi:hypothetical protein EE612_003882, partial [Oryza sativa]